MVVIMIGRKRNSTRSKIDASGASPRSRSAVKQNRTIMIPFFFTIPMSRMMASEQSR